MRSREQVQRQFKQLLPAFDICKELIVLTFLARMILIYFLPTLSSTYTCFARICVSSCSLRLGKIFFFSKEAFLSFIALADSAH